MRLIDADELIKAWNNLYECEEKWEKHFGADFNIHGRPEMQAGFGAAHDAIINAPNADVAEVKHGRWEVAGDMSYVKCSHCGGLFVCYYNYCPNCGAKMVNEDAEQI